MPPAYFDFLLHRPTAVSRFYDPFRDFDYKYFSCRIAHSGIKCFHLAFIGLMFALMCLRLRSWSWNLWSRGFGFALTQGNMVVITSLGRFF